MCLIISLETSCCVTYTYSFPGEQSHSCLTVTKKHSTSNEPKHLSRMQVNNLWCHNVSEKMQRIEYEKSVYKAALFTLKQPKQAMAE